MNIIIYGAGQDGEIAYRTLMMFPENEILFFVDRDPDKQSDTFCGRRVLPISVLDDYLDKNVRIVISTRGSYVEVFNKLKMMGFTDIIGLGNDLWNDKRRRHYIYSILNKERCIDLGKFLYQDSESICLPQVPFVNGGSGIMDYAFLYVIAKKLRLNTYLEIGTYIGTSINIMSRVCKRCYGVTAPIGAPYSMRQWCKTRNIPDYSSALTNRDNIKMYYANSRKFDFSIIDDDIDIFFIDGDHTYNGVYSDTRSIFELRKPSSIVVWHDFTQDDYSDDVILAVKDFLGDDFDNVYITNNNICGIYIPQEYKKVFPTTVKEFKETSDQKMYVYDLVLKQGLIDLG